ncbi:peptidoglycan D,D-transpeptidase FtsI family protein [Lachnobacterium bovis]|uniref:Stage V sporulation protein D (Sporulation-specific penicillin-binding protein) n=1 Tax=Lachnobacterium bovis TaxID=140626 RepID=A0A1H9TTY2_9FIRM|nr:penicillin-binding transpeptidase domain-containing protein [Lachnobacterium bovis]SES00213.1 stage V sporulation protein D (sporulation-specific penicillin-binding protein) [Lachnobacterium bovis]
MARRVRRRRVRPKFNKKMRKKLILLFGILMIVFVILIVMITYLNIRNKNEYEKIVLDQQAYGSRVIPFRRGDILDRNGTILATSEPVYSVIMDCTIINSNKKTKNNTLKVLKTAFNEVDENKVKQILSEKKNSRYVVLLKKQPKDKKDAFEQLKKNSKNKKFIKGIWFEKHYQRKYPYGSLASSVIGFASSGNVGTIGLENQYNSTLNGINGREYGYLKSASNIEKSIIEPKEGKSIVTTLDLNLQLIVERKIKEFNDAYANNARPGTGSKHTAVIMMNPNNGEVLAMASYPNFDLNNPRDLSAYYSQDEINAMSDETKMDNLNKLWQNFCVNYTYEPGSIQKPLTVATGLETGTVKRDMTFYCDGGEFFGKTKIRCESNHGVQTVQQALMNSCNDSLMQMSYLIGKERFEKYMKSFGMYQKTGIDLPGEVRNKGLIRTADKMTPVDLATNAFGQNYNCTMIQMISAFSSIINGGSYYQPHMVKRTIDSKNNTISVNDNSILRQTISKSTSDQVKEYLYHVVDAGTGTTAKLDGYSMGGKTGTAEKLPRGKHNYLVSFMGYVPQNNPKVIIYCIVDEPNSDNQPHSTYAQNIAREILKEALPYLGVYMDEQPTGRNADKSVVGNGAIAPKSAPQQQSQPSDLPVEASDVGDDNQQTGEEQNQAQQEEAKKKQEEAVAQEQAEQAQ